MELTSISRIEDIRERYASVHATGSYVDTLKEFQTWEKTELQTWEKTERQPWALANGGITVGMVGGKPSDFGFQAVQFLPPEADPLALGMSPDAVMRAYAEGSGIGSQSGSMETFWNSAPGKFKSMDPQTRGVSATNPRRDFSVSGGPWAPEEVREWRAAAQPFLSSFASNHRAEYDQAADKLGIPHGPFDLTKQYYDLDDKYGDDLSAGQPKSNAERIFYAIASPEEIAEFEKQMEGFQQPIDQFYAGKADDLARTLQFEKDMLQYSKDLLQHAKELKAASDQLNEDFSNLGLDKFTLAQLSFKQGADGSIQVSGHPQANEIADAINGDTQFAELISFAFGFTGRNSVSA